MRKVLAEASAAPDFIETARRATAPKQVRLCTPGKSGLARERRAELRATREGGPSPFGGTGPQENPSLDNIPGALPEPTLDPVRAIRACQRAVTNNARTRGRSNYWLAARRPLCSSWAGRRYGTRSMAASPYGFWTSPITSDLVVGDSIRLEQVALDGDAIYWSETQPQKQGRTFVYRVGADGEPERVTPDDADAFSVRTRAHEYGGGSFAVSDGVVYFLNNLDQRFYRQDGGRLPIPITPAPSAAAADALRYADGVIDRRRGRLVCVREDHTGAGEAITTLVAVNLSGATVPQVLVSGNDFYSTPRLSPDGNRMSWLTWRHPDMPWVTTEAWVGDILPDGTIASARRVAGGPNESVFQPEWSPDGDLYFVSDRVSGWWNLYRERDGAIEPLVEMDAEFGRPQWQFGMSTYAFESPIA